MALAVAFSNGDGKVGAVYFAKPASDAIIRSLDNRSPVRVATDDVLGTKRNTDAARFTPVSKYLQIVELP